MAESERQSKCLGRDITHPALSAPYLFQRLWHRVTPRGSNSVDTSTSPWSPGAQTGSGKGGLCPRQFPHLLRSNCHECRSTTVLSAKTRDPQVIARWAQDQGPRGGSSMAWPPGATKVNVGSQEWRVPYLELVGKHIGRRGQAGFPEEEIFELSSKEEAKRRQDERQAHHRLQAGPGGPQTLQGTTRDSQEGLP